MTNNCESCGASNEADASFCVDCGKPLRSTDTVGGLQTEPYPQPGGRGERTSSEDAFHLQPGDLFADRYTIVDTIGQGGMGVVYRATEELAGKIREIALKLIRADRLIDDRAVDKLISEGALTQDIRHPNVVAVYNVGKAEGQPFVAMEFVEGTSLREWHRRKINAREEIDVAVVAAIIGALLDGLEAAHSKGVIHRDLKPENIALTAEPSSEQASLQILDFGIARAPGTVDSATGTGLGTPRYMAPEQITHPDGAGPPADLYSLSVIFYELLMDVLPQGHWQPPSGGRTDVPTAIDALIEAGLSNRPASRPQTTQDYRKILADALPSIAPDPPAPAPSPPPPSPPPPPPEGSNTLRNALIGGGVVVGLLVLIGAIVEEPEEPGIPQDDEYIYVDDVPHVLDEDGDLVRADGGGGNDVDPEPEPGPDQLPPPPPPPEEPVLTFADMAGRWNVELGGYFDIQVDNVGNFSGSGVNPLGMPVEISGNLQTLRYIANGFNGQLTWDGACHLGFVTYNPNGTINVASTFHIDHAPGAACPARFSR